VDVLLTKPVVVALAILGAALSSSASFLQTRGYVGEKGARAINYAGYACMGVSMVFFALAGLWS
jgi:hypothetical protein